jgi:purine-binding chemotaxis protein CheW
MMETESGLEQTQYLTFQLAGEEYAIGILQVKEIIPYLTLTAVPQTPASIRGVINLRGSVVPVIDLAVKLGLSPKPITARSCIVIVETKIATGNLIMGVIADSVSQVIDLPPQEISATPPFGTGVQIDFLRGIGRSGQKFVLVLDIDKVLGSDDADAETRANGSGAKVADGKARLKQSNSNHELDSA